MVLTKNYILHLQDSLVDAYLVREALHKFDSKIDIIKLHYGAELLPFLEKHADALPKLIIIEWSLPDMNGTEILQVLKSNMLFPKEQNLLAFGSKAKFSQALSA